MRPITLGQWVSENSQNLWVVESGLKPGDVLIVDGVAKLRPGAPVKVAGPPSAAPAAPPAAAPKPAPKA